MSNREVVVENIVKSYAPAVVAVDDVSFKVESGQIFGFLGPNGAGKSTLVKILTTLALPTSGRALVGGHDVATQPAKVREIAGVALQEIGIDPIMKPLELLTLQGQLFGSSKRDAAARAQQLIELVNLTDAVDRKAGTFSGGMRRRLDLAMALVHEPEILFLDEPTTGLDPASRRDVWAEVRRLNQQLGMTIFLTTQYLEEADELADTVAIIDQGKIVASGSPAKLRAGLGGQASINLAFENKTVAANAAQLLSDLSSAVQVDRDVVRLYLDNAAQAVPGVVARLNQADVTLLSLTLTQPTLDDVFLQVTGQRLKSDQTQFAEENVQ